MGIYYHGRLVLRCFRCNDRFLCDEKRQFKYKQSGNRFDLPYICSPCDEYNYALWNNLPLPVPGPLKDNYLMELDLENPEPTLFDQGEENAR